tara:strand:+ start:52 stop:273 length:222 start_codon:yes stop_codon:yes gene_type:complete
MAEISEVKSEVSEVSGNEERLQQKVEVTVGDLQVFVNIIEATTQRGAFRAPELKGVGEFFERISALIPKETTK